MEQDNERKVFRQLVWIKWLVGIVALSFAIIAGAFGWFVWIVGDEFKDKDLETSFRDRGSELLEQGNEAEVLSLAAVREKDFPKDPYVFWYRGRAHYQLGQDEDSLKAFSRTEELAPSWRDEHIIPYTSTIRTRMGTPSTSQTDLRSAPNPTVQRDTPPARP